MEWGVTTYQIGEGVQFLAHQTSLLPPARDFPIHKVEEETERDEAQSQVEICVVRWVILYAVTKRGEDGHDTAETYESTASAQNTLQRKGGRYRTVQLGDEVGEMEGTKEGEVASFRAKEPGLLVLRCYDGLARRPCR